YGITLLLTRVRIISMMISALTPDILFVMSLVMVNFDLVNLNIVFSGTIIGIIVNGVDRKSTRLNSSHVSYSYVVFCLKRTSYIFTLSLSRPSNTDFLYSFPTRLSSVLYGITLLLTRVRIISMMISALTPVILFVMSLVMVNFDLVNLNIVFSGTIIGIIVNG